MSEADLDEARAEMIETHRSLNLPADGITDEQVYHRAVHRIVESAPDRLDVGELHLELRHALTRLDELDEIGLSWQDKQAAKDATAPHIVAVLTELDRRSALVGTGSKGPEPGPARREWALSRVAALGHMPDIEARHLNVPLAVHRWFEERAVATLRSAGDDVPSRSALTKACARWSWTGSQVGQIYSEAFPPSTVELAQRSPEHDLIITIATRARKLREDSYDDRADQLVSSAKDFLRLWLDDDTDPVVIELRRSAERHLQ